MSLNHKTKHAALLNSTYRHRFFIALFVGMCLPVFALGQYKIGERVFVLLPNDNLKDGYAIGHIESITDDKATVFFTQFVPAHHRTLAGTCHPSGLNPLAGADVIKVDPANIQIKQTFHLQTLQPYTQGHSDFLDREQIKTVLDKWHSDSFGITPERLEQMAEKAQSINAEHAVFALKIAAITQAVVAPRGYPQGKTLQQAALPGAQKKLIALTQTIIDPKALPEIATKALNKAQDTFNALK